MTKEEYNEKKEEIKNNHFILLKQLGMKFAIENNIVNIGDTIKDHMSIIKVDKIQVCNTAYDPSCIYFGIRLKRNLKSFKSGETTSIYQCNLKYINNQKYIG